MVDPEMRQSISNYVSVSFFVVVLFFLTQTITKCSSFVLCQLHAPCSNQNIISILSNFAAAKELFGNHQSLAYVKSMELPYGFYLLYVSTKDIRFYF